MGILLCGGESLTFRNRGAIVGKSSTMVGGGLFLPSCVQERNKIVVEGKVIHQVLMPAFIGGDSFILGQLPLFRGSRRGSNVRNVTVVARSKLR